MRVLQQFLFESPYLRDVEEYNVGEKLVFGLKTAVLERQGPICGNLPEWDQAGVFTWVSQDWWLSQAWVHLPAGRIGLVGAVCPRALPRLIGCHPPTFCEPKLHFLGKIWSMAADMLIGLTKILETDFLPGVSAYLYKRTTCDDCCHSLLPPYSLWFPVEVYHLPGRYYAPTRHTRSYPTGADASPQN